MSIKYKFIFLLLLTYLHLNADTNATKNLENSYLDHTHNIISDTLHDWSDYLDKKLSSHSDANNTQNSPRINQTKAKAKSIDSFFQTRKFIDSTEETFVRINFNSFFQSRAKESFKYKIRAHIPLSRTKKSYNLFLEDITQDNLKSTLANQGSDATSPDIGINYFAPDTYGINSKYSIGTSGINPFVRARFNLSYKTDNWIIQPVQLFKYSSNKKFEEETNIYFDKLLSNSELIRFTLYRATQEKERGMDYALVIEYFKSLKNKSAFGITQSFSGNTKYQDIPYNSNVTGNTEIFEGVNNYYTSIHWRQNIWKKWFYYELTPGVNFHRKRDYQPNYSILLSVDMYFGKFFKK